MKRITDNTSYVLLGTLLGAFGFFVINLLFLQTSLELLLAPLVGAVLGCLAGIKSVRDKKLPMSATFRDFKAAAAREKALKP
jgi:hypothetical protein